MKKIPRYAIIPTHNRHELLVSLLHQIADQVDLIYVIDNASDQPLSELWLKVQVPAARTIVVRDEEQPPHLYKMWNDAFKRVAATSAVMREEMWDIIVLNDDSNVPSGWVDYVCKELRSQDNPQRYGGDPAIVCTDAYGTLLHPQFKHQRDGNIMTRMCPWAFVVRGELGLRADESMRWWWGDTDFEWQAIEHGGVLLLPGKTVKNTLANSTTHGALAEQAGRDGETFTAKWGRRPW